jgi:hypothetical protein
MRLHDPMTGTIPRSIASREQAFVRSIAKSAGKAHSPLINEWQRRGPFYIGGRTKALALDVRSERIIVAGGVSSGMFKSIDGGATWYKTTSPDQLHSVSCIAQNTAPGRRYIWYYGTGEWAGGLGGSAAGPLGSQSQYRGDGVFKSTDRGESWTQVASTVSATPDRTDEFDFIWDLATFGSDGVYAATSNGLFRSTDGGGSWDHVIDPGGAYPNTEVAVTEDGTVYATVGGDGPETGIYRSYDGLTWERFSPPDFPGATIRTVIAPVPSQSGTIFFFTCEEYSKTHLYKYQEGIGWSDLRENLPGGGDMSTYGGNMMLLKIKPDDEDTIFLGTIGFYRSMDGGQSFEVIGAHAEFHVDQHSLVFLPSDPRKMIVGNDGGLFKTNDNLAEVGRDPVTGEDRIEWQSLNNGYLTTQFYSVALDHEIPGSEAVAGGMQDNGSMVTFSAALDDPWLELFPGDGGFLAFADHGTSIYTSNAATLRVLRHTFEGGEHQVIEVTPTSGLMGLWMGPMLIDPHDTRIMYLPARRDLWRNSDLTEIPYAFPITRTDVNWTRMENVDDYITAIAMSPASPRRIYYGTLSRELARIDSPHQGQPTPVKLPMDTLPENNQGAYIGCIAVDPRDIEKLLLVYPNYEVISIFASEDAGITWTPIAGNLEEYTDGSGAGPSVRWVSILYVEDHPFYFAATSAGLFSTSKLAGMSTFWIQEGTKTFGNVVVDMVDVRQSDGTIVVGTHGNGVYSATLAPPTPRRARRWF